MRGATNQHLLAILDLHEFGAMGDDPAANKDKFLGFWRRVALRYKDASDAVLFEILNEPSRKLSPELWNDHLKQGLAILRQSNPSRTVIVGPGFWNSIDHRKELELPDTDTNLIVTVHYYQPMSFTHQGAGLTNQKDKTGVSWEGTAGERQKIQDDFDKVMAWAGAHHRPVFLGEFGAYDRAPIPGHVIRMLSHAPRKLTAGAGPTGNGTATSSFSMLPMNVGSSRSCMR